MNNILISSSILSADFACLRDQIQAAEAAGIDWVHIDVMDGHFVPNISMGPLIVETCRRITSLPLDVHLMIDQPERYIDAFARAGADRISVHIENAPHIYRTLEAIRALKASPSIVLNPGTPGCALAPVLHLVDMVLVMSVNPGFGGQKYIAQVTPKISEIRAMLDQTNPNAIIEVDGGINAGNIGAVRAAGAQVFVAGSAIFNHPAGIAAGVQALRNAAG